MCTTRRIALTILCTLTAAATAALAASNVDPWRKSAWSENTGWLNWRDAGSPIASQGVQLVSDTHLTGFIWGENIGWINTGNAPGPYTNTDHTNFGINVDPITGDLSGYAWGENIGWINFSGGALASPPNPARYDSGRLRGYAWGENIGWINLDLTTDNKYVALPPCAGDANGDGLVDFNDITAVLANWLTTYTPPGATGPGDANTDGTVDFNDITTILANWLTTCP